MRRTYGIVLVLLICFHANGQQVFQLSGRVIDSAGAGLTPATVELTDGEDTLTTVTSTNGDFILPRVAFRPFKLHISMKGYVSYEHTIGLVSGKNLHLSPITLKPDFQELDPVVVSRQRAIIISGDTISYNTSAFPVQDGADIEEILRRLPGVEVDMDGDVYVHGKKLERVIVNGKEFFGGNVLLAIRNLPADITSKLQVIDDYGDQARLTGIKVGEPAKVLNIVLKNDKRDGGFGQVQAGAGSAGKYVSQVFANRFENDRQISGNFTAADNNPAGPDPNHSAAASYADQWGPKVSWGLSGATNNDNPHTQSRMSQQTYYPGDEINTNQSSETNTSIRSQGGSGIVTIKPNGHTTLRISPLFGNNTLLQQSQISSTILEQDSTYLKSTLSQAANRVRTSTRNVSTNVYFEKSVPESHKLFSVQGNIHYTGTGQFSDNILNSQVILDSQVTYTPTHYEITNKSPTVNLSLVSKYFFPLARQSFLDLGYNTQSSLSSTNIRTQSLDSVSQSLSIVDSLSSQTQYNTYFQELHGGYIGMFHSLSLWANVNGRQTSMVGTVGEKAQTISYHYLSLLPQIDATWKISQAKSLSFNYRTSNNLPSLQQINPIPDVTNPQALITGNSGLKPSSTKSIAAHYESSNLRPNQYSGIGIGFTYSVTENPIITSTSHPKDSTQVIQATTFINTGHISGIGANYEATMPSFLHHWLTILLKGNVSRGQSLTMTDGILYPTTNYSLTQELHLHLLIPDVTDVDFQGNYSVVRTVYVVASGLPGSFQSAFLAINVKQNFFKHWSFVGRLSQIYSDAGRGLTPTPAAMTGSIQRELFRHNKASITLSGFNLLNSMSGTSESLSAITKTQTQSSLVGRYFLLTFDIKLQKFH